ncbi:MAG: nitroreductase/quinone reductase family protein, partial [Blastococcus sp.]
SMIEMRTSDRHRLAAIVLLINCVDVPRSVPSVVLRSTMSTSPADFNAQIIEQFRANEGRVGGIFEGSSLLLLHHTGAKSGTSRINPLGYLSDGGRYVVFASKAGAPTNPDWYYNLTAAGEAEVEVGTERYPVTVTEMTGAERDRVFAEQARRYPGFAGYEEKTAGVRTIPVLALGRL